jgi:hypothetical protein
LTTAPSETIEQYISLFNSAIEFNDYDVLYLPQDLARLTSENSKVVICSKQYLQSKTGENKIEQLADIQFDCVFLDESHYGGTTELCEKILNTYKCDYRIFITATYQKPTATYNIAEDACLLWDIEDNTLAKNITDKTFAARLIAKHGAECKELLSRSNVPNIQTQYKEFPELHVITPELLKEYHEELKDLIDLNYGFSIESLFMLKHDNVVRPTFIDSKGVIKFLQYVFGTPIKVGRTNIEISDNRSLLNRAADIAGRHNMDYYGNMPIILIFLPCNLDKMPISTLSTALRELIENNFTDFGCIDINSHSNKGQNVKSVIYDNYQHAKLNGKKALIVLSGRQASLGISLKECHTVILLNNTTSMDMLYQMMFRSMTEAAGKTCGFVIDLNIHRSITLITDYAYKINRGNAGNISSMIHSILKQRLITFNYDEHFSIDQSDKFTNIVKKIVSIWTQPNSIGSILERINIKNNLFSHDEMLTISGLLMINKETAKKINEEIQKLSGDLSNGIEKESTKINGGEVHDEEKVTEDETDYDKININQQFLVYIVPLLCLLSIDNESSSLDIMMNYIKQNTKLNKCLLHQLQVFYANILPANVLKVFLLIYNRSIKNNQANEEMVMRLKQLFSLHLKDREKLGQIIDKYLIPHDNERRIHAEVSTPYVLRQEMLDSITKYGDVNFWKTPKTVFEPCCGKGGFVVDLVEKFMNGLSDIMPDKEERYRYIVEHCIYFADINPLNIFVTKLLIDPFGKYKLNNYLGDTLAIDIEQEFKLDGFDLVVGNPPYNDELKSTGASPLYHKFIYKYEPLTKLLQFIVPSRWFAGGKGLSEFRVWMKSRTDIVYIRHYFNSKQIFGSNVEIEGGVDHFLINKDHNGLCLFNNTLIDLDKYDIIVQESKYYKLIDRIIYKPNILQLYKPQQYYGIKSNDNRLVDKAEVDHISVYVSKQKGFKKYIDKKYIDVDVKKWKVITARANGKYGCFGNKFIGKPNECHSQSYISFEVTNEGEANSLLSYLQCKLPNLLLSVRKLSQDISADTCRWIPLVPLDRTWSDDQLFEYFRLSKELISLVKSAKIVGWK